MDHNRPVEFLGDDGFFVSAQVVAPFCGVAGFLQNLDRIVVGDARKRRNDFFQRCDVAFNQRQFARTILGHGLHDGADQAFGQLDHVFQVRVGGFGLEHPEFSQVPPCFRFLGTKRGAEGVNLAQSSGQRLDIELARLGQVSFLIVDVIHFKEGGRAFAGGGSKDRSIGLRVTLRIHVIARGTLRFGANTQNRRLGGACESTGAGGRAENRRRALSIGSDTAQNRTRAE